MVGIGCRNSDEEGHGTFEHLGEENGCGEEVALSGGGRYARMVHDHTEGSVLQCEGQ